MIRLLFNKERCRYTHDVLVLAALAQHVATLTTSILNFREENFRDQKSNHEIHENIVPQKFGTIRYVYRIYTLTCNIFTPIFNSMQLGNHSMEKFGSKLIL